MVARRDKGVMTRSYRVFLNDLNGSKQEVLKSFLYRCHDIMQYFVDLFWQRRDFRGKLADLPTVHRAVKRFSITTRLSQAIAKQGAEIVAGGHKRSKKRRPRLQRHVVTLFYHFVSVEPFRGEGFDWAVRFTSSGAPKGLVVPFSSTKPLNEKLADSWSLRQTIRLGMRKGRLFIDLLLKKKRPKPKQEGRIVGMDSNYKNGVVFSDSQVVGENIYQRIQGFKKRQKNTHAEIKSMLGHALKSVDWSSIQVLSIEDLKRVKHGKRGTFSRVFNRRLSHWLYRTLVQFLERKCEEEGIQLVVKDPFKTSQFCSACNRWDRRNRKGERFKCVHCGYQQNADHNAAHNLELLGVAGVYGLRSYLSSKRQTFG